MMAVGVVGLGLILGVSGLNSAPVEIGIEAEHFEYLGDWWIANHGQLRGGECLEAPNKHKMLPAVTAIDVPASGTYHLWLRALDFPKDAPGTRRSVMAIGAQFSSREFGNSGKEGFQWQQGGAFQLEAGRTLLTLRPVTPYARVDAILLTTDASFVPEGNLDDGNHRMKATRPVSMGNGGGMGELNCSALKILGDRQALLENEHVRISFVTASREDQRVIVPQIELRVGEGWRKIPTQPEAERYTVVRSGVERELKYPGFFPLWSEPGSVQVELNGVRVETSQRQLRAMWEAGELSGRLPISAIQEANRVRLCFPPDRNGRLEAVWELRGQEHAARVTLDYVPAEPGQYALGYHLFFKQPVSSVDEVLLPMMWQRRRLPEEPRTLLDPFMPTPVSLVARTDSLNSAVVWALVGDPGRIGFQWPHQRSPHYGMGIRHPDGDVQPSIYGPVIGTEAAHKNAGERFSFSFRVLVQPGDWYAGYRTAADEVFQLTDYRRNVGVSMTEAALNMLDLAKDDDRGGWWKEAKGFYQIESKNGVTNAAPLSLLALYRLTSDEDLYRRRVLPSLEYVMSRPSAHFSILPHDTGRYRTEGVKGPTKLFGSPVFAGLWEMSGRRSEAFREIALPGNEVRPTTGYSHAQPFDDWLARYEITGEAEALKRARQEADRYVETQFIAPPTEVLSPQPFYFISFVPAWEGLLRLYEFTGEKRYLDAAAFGARQLMAGIWTQPLIPEGAVTVNAGGQFKADTMHSMRGSKPYRLGTPRRPNDTPEAQLPAWMVSNVGLGFEQPTTYRGQGPGRMIYQLGWAADFLRLARHTGDASFETYARNAAVGRWANYPGYYLTGFTDLPFRPDYPYQGPDVTTIYYHHIVPHLGWTIDYLVAEAELRSAGAVSFPSQRQVGYAYFDSRAFGHAPGRVFDEAGVWLWFQRGLVAIDNPQLNYLTARRGENFFVMLTNASGRTESARVRLGIGRLKLDAAVTTRAVAVHAKDPDRVIEHGEFAVTLPPKGLQVWKVSGAKVDVPTHHVGNPTRPGTFPSRLTLSGTMGVWGHGAVIQVKPESWDAFLWCSAEPEEATEVTLHFRLHAQWQQMTKSSYPFEFSVPVGKDETSIAFYFSGRGARGEFRTDLGEIGPRVVAP